MTRTQPPHYVPTLTEVVQPSSKELASGSGADISQEELIHRVMQRVDLMLERRVRETIAAAVLEQTRTVAPALRAEIESVVRETVLQMLAQESARGQRS